MCKHVQCDTSNNLWQYKERGVAILLIVNHQEKTRKTKKEGGRKKNLSQVDNNKQTRTEKQSGYIPTQLMEQVQSCTIKMVTIVISLL